MARLRPSTAEIAATIDGFYDDFCEEIPSDGASSETLSDLGSPHDRPGSAQQLEAVQEEYAALAEENAELCRRAKIVLQQRAQGRQKITPDASKLKETETRFRAALKQWPTIRQEKDDTAQQYYQKTASLQATVDAKRSRVEAIEKTFAEFRLKITSELLKSDPKATQEVSRLLNSEKNVAMEMQSLRLECVRLESQRRQLDKKMAERDRLGEGLHLMDFEQLKIENQTLNEKIDERNQELIQLKKKTSGIVQVLTHVCEKLHFVKARREGERERLREKATVLAAQKTRLQQVKQQRSQLQYQTDVLNRRCLKVTQPSLLEDIAHFRTQRAEYERRLAR